MITGKQHCDKESEWGEIFFPQSVCHATWRSYLYSEMVWLDECGGTSQHWFGNRDNCDSFPLALFCQSPGFEFWFWTLLNLVSSELELPWWIMETALCGISFRLGHHLLPHTSVASYESSCINRRMENRWCARRSAFSWRLEGPLWVELRPPPDSSSEVWVPRTWLHLDIGLQQM